MDQLENSKFVPTSKFMLFVFRGLFILFILMVLIPWLFPSSNIAKFLLSFHGHATLTEHNKKILLPNEWVRSYKANDTI